MSQNPYDPNAQQPQDPYGQGGNHPGHHPSGYYSDGRQGTPGNAGQQGYQGPQGYPGQPGNYPPPQYYARPYPTDGGLSTLQLNLWLSVFFGWIPALIFFVSARDNAHPAVREAHTKNMNFAIIRVICGAVAVVPFVGWILGGLATVVLFIFAIINAAQVPGQITSGRRPEFVLENVTAPAWIK